MFLLGRKGDVARALETLRAFKEVVDTYHVTSDMSDSFLADVETGKIPEQEASLLRQR